MGQESLRRGQMGYWPVIHEGKGTNCFSIIQLVRQKRQYM